MVTVVEIELIQVMVVTTLQLRCFKMAARLAVRSENKLELEKEGLSAKTLNFKTFCLQRILPLVSQFCRTHVVCKR